MSPVGRGLLPSPSLGGRGKGESDTFGGGRVIWGPERPPQSGKEGRVLPCVWKGGGPDAPLSDSLTPPVHRPDAHRHLHFGVAHLARSLARPTCRRSSSPLVLGLPSSGAGRGGAGGSAHKDYDAQQAPRLPSSAPPFLAAWRRPVARREMQFCGVGDRGGKEEVGILGIVVCKGNSLMVEQAEASSVAHWRS